MLDFSKPTDIRQLGLSTHKVQYYHPTLDPSKQVWDLSPLTSELQWADDMHQAAAEITIRLGHHDSLKNIIKSGGILTIFGQMVQPDGTSVQDEIVRGVVFRKASNPVQNSSSITITAFDHMAYTAKSQDSEVFKNKTASDIIRYIADKISLPLGTVVETTYKIPRLVLRKNTWYDMMIIALTESRWVDGERYILRMEKGKLNLLKKVLPAKVWLFEYGKNIFDASLNESIEEMRNKIIVYGNQSSDQIADITSAELTDITNDVLPVLAGGDDDPIQDDKKIADYGLLQHIETGTTPERFADAKEYGQHLLETLSRVAIDGTLSVPNINSVRWGDAIYIYEPLSGMAAQYYVQASKHMITPSSSRMELTIAFEDLLPENLLDSLDGKQNSSDVFQDILDAEGITRRVGQRQRVSDTGELALFVAPLNDPYQITQEYGANKGTGYNGPVGHSGIDMANGGGSQALNQPVYAAGTGKVIFSGDTGGLGGTMIKIDHGSGLETWYAHLNYVDVAAGDNVKRGAAIGLVGQTGSADPRVNPAGGPHLHFQVLRNGVTIDPREIVSIHS